MSSKHSVTDPGTDAASLQPFENVMIVDSNVASCQTALVDSMHSRLLRLWTPFAVKMVSSALLGTAPISSRPYQNHAR